jgi:PAS domain S-box-containing protein
VGLCLIGADLRYLRINERLAAMNGLPADDHLGRTVWEVIPEAAPFVAPLLLRIIESGRPVLDWQFRTEKSAEGGPRDLLASYYPVKAASGQIVGVAGVVQEITELKRVERALRESEQRFRALIENSADGFVLLDSHGKLLYSGPPILGYEGQEFRSGSVFDLIHPDERPGLPGAFAAFLERPGAVVTSEHRVRHRDGSWRRVEAVGKNLLGDRVIAGIVVNYRDVTERKRLDEQLRQTQKAGEHRRAGRRRGTRFQQSADRRAGQCHAGFRRAWAGTRRQISKTSSRQERARRTSRANCWLIPERAASSSSLWTSRT